MQVDVEGYRKRRLRVAAGHIELENNTSIQRFEGQHRTISLGPAEDEFVRVPQGRI